MVDVETLDDWLKKLRTQWDWVAGCSEFALLWDSEEFQYWFEKQSQPARASLNLIVKSVVGSNAVAGVARLFDNNAGENRICIPRMMHCLEEPELASDFCRADNEQLQLTRAKDVWETLKDTNSRRSLQANNQTKILEAFRDYRNARQAHLLDFEPEGVFYTDLWHLADKAGEIIELLGAASGTYTVSASATKKVWRDRHQSLFEAWQT